MPTARSTLPAPPRYVYHTRAVPAAFSFETNTSTSALLPMDRSTPTPSESRSTI
jgi:hypothetical protein